MRRLIWGFAGRRYHIVGNILHWLKCCCLIGRLNCERCLRFMSISIFWRLISDCSGLHPFVLFVLMLYDPINNFSHVGTISCLHGLNNYLAADKCLVQGHNTVTLVSLDWLATIRPQSSALPTEPLCSLSPFVNMTCCERGLSFGAWVNPGGKSHPMGTVKALA